MFHYIVNIYCERDQRMSYIKHDVFMMTMSHDKIVIEENQSIEKTCIKNEKWQASKMNLMRATRSIFSYIFFSRKTIPFNMKQYFYLYSFKISFYVLVRMKNIFYRG